MSAGPLFAVAVLAAAASPAAAETRTSQSGVPFCKVLASFRSLIAAMLARDEAAAAHLDDCVFLKVGVRVEVLPALVELSPGSRIVAVRVFGSGHFVGGYGPHHRGGHEVGGHVARHPIRALFRRL